MLVSEIMTTDPITAAPKDTLRDVMDRMYSEDIRHVPVVDGTQLIGIISDRDMRSLSLPVSTILNNPGETAKRLEKPVSAVMRGDVQYVEADADVEGLIDMMVESKVGAVPVVDPGTETLVGIVSYIDVLLAARSSL